MGKFVTIAAMSEFKHPHNVDELMALLDADRRQLEQDYADNITMYQDLPFSDLRFRMPEDGVELQALHAFKLHRLMRVGQLGYLAVIGPNPEEEYRLEFTHDRFEHSTVVSLLSDTVLKRNGFDEQARNTARVISMLHDRKTPAGGDATKLLDPVWLNEERDPLEELPEEGYRFMAERGVDPAVVAHAIEGNGGFYGKILDVFDKVAYVFKDLHNVSQIPPPFPQRLLFEGPGPLTEGETKRLAYQNFDPKIAEILKEYPDIGNIYKDISINGVTADIYFTDPQRLTAFLSIRNRLHTRLYMEPSNQGRDLFMATLAKPFYDRDGSTPLNPQNLRLMEDNDLMRFLIQQYGEHDFPADHLKFAMCRWMPRYIKYETDETLANSLIQLRKDPNILLLGTRHTRSFNPATHFKTIGKNGGIVSLHEGYPELATPLEEEAKEVSAKYLYYGDLTPGKFDSYQDHVIKRLLLKIPV